MKIAILYHSADYDGILSNEVCRHWLVSGPVPDEAVESFGWDYGRPLPEGIKWEEFETIYIVDLSSERLMGREDLRSKIIWIDHHKTAIDQWHPVFEFQGYRIDGVAACRLCWQWFYRDFEYKHGELPVREDFVARRVREPELIRLAGEYDIFDLRDPNTTVLQAGLKQLDPDEFGDLLGEEFSEPMRFISEALGECLKIGVRAQRSMDRAAAEKMKNNSHTVIFRGIKFLACNAVKGSLAFKSAIRPEHEALLAWEYDGKNRQATVSLYHAPGKEYHDLSLIAKSMGGGGHKGACGFRVGLTQLDGILSSQF